MRLTATAMLPTNDPPRARAALRARLRSAIATQKIPAAAMRGARLRVVGPDVITDARGRTWFEWTAMLQTRPTVDDLGLLRRRLH